MAKTNKEIGVGLRKLRKMIGLSLAQVEAMSYREFKSSILGAYERGERAITVVRHEQLLDFYQAVVVAGVMASDAS